MQLSPTERVIGIGMGIGMGMMGIRGWDGRWAHGMDEYRGPSESIENLTTGA